MEIKEIIKTLKEQKIDFELNENEDEIFIKSCDLGDNFYDYGEKEPKLKIDNPKLKFLKDCNNVVINRCCDCCGCAGW